MTTPISNTEGEPLDSLPVLSYDTLKVKYPEIIYTDAYLNDPIRFVPESTLFDPPIPPRAYIDGKSYNRDVAGYMTVYINDEENPKNEDLYIQMISPTYQRYNYNRYIKKDFTELA